MTAVAADQYRHDAFGQYIYVRRPVESRWWEIQYPSGQRRNYLPSTIEQNYPHVTKKPESWVHQ